MADDLPPLHTPAPGLDDDLRLQPVQRRPHVVEQGQGCSRISVRHPPLPRAVALTGVGQQSAEQGSIPLQSTRRHTVTRRKASQVGMRFNPQVVQHDTRPTPEGNGTTFHCFIGA
ncbi:hypothetical protein [Streptomyces sp. NPDC012825]|uniref:hypothetical protein n=1 Tax=Streptomyces sp. NPDC012825 TaxID=3364851 RepID=UPI003685F692